ncbi:MAG TPA: uroporphyrinogen-III C-methyltransferase [Candidatus Dormibacteraeota bacterium]|nr:uroporphyrinogen-III C-methyltransferase [Candidatus Dormibacteraeota bacterium]
MRYYPVYLDLMDQRAVVLGDGPVATDKAALLREAGAVVTVIAAGDYRPGDLAGARIVVDASGDSKVNRLAWEEAEAAGILINVLDRPEQCRFIAPAIVRRDPVVIAISTSGESPFLASQLRVRIERLLGTEWGPFTALVGRIRRRLREQAVPIATQTRVYRRLLQADLRSMLRAGRTTAAYAHAATLAERSAQWRGRVAIVGAGPGDPELLTLRARELLFDADVVLHDALISPETLALSGPDTRLEAVGKRGGSADSVSQESINARLIELAADGHFVVRLKGGDPFVFGRGGEELQVLVDAGVDVIVVPGITSALAAPAALGIPATLRGTSSSVTITSGHSEDLDERLVELARVSDTLVVLMARARLAQIARVLAAAVGASTPAAVVGNATLATERHVIGTLANIAALADRQQIQAAATLIVGQVVSAAPRSEGVLEAPTARG